MEPLPMAPSCSLDEDGLRRQRERYAEAGRGARVVERTPRRVVVALATGADPGNVQRLLAVERECCPFFDLGWDPARRRLSVAVPEAGLEPALDAIVDALGLHG
jgi:hypothetical protein